MVKIVLTLGERAVIMHLLNESHDFERTHSNMRKVTRVKYAIQYKAVLEDISVVRLLEDTTKIETELDKELLGWLWGLFEKFNKWPSQLSDWTVTLCDKLLEAVATGMKEEAK